MKFIAFILNIPYTIIGLIIALVSVPKKLTIHKKPFALVVHIQYWWWAIAYTKGARAAAMGNIVLLGNRTKPFDLEHELVHVRQHEQWPLIYPILYFVEMILHGYRKNKFEEEAYRLSGSIYEE